MEDFPEFMKGQANRIATSSQATPGVEGYVFDGTDGSQIAFWTCTKRQPRPRMFMITTNTWSRCKAATR